MTQVSTSKLTNIHSNERLYRQIVRRMTPIIIGIFVVLGAAGIIVFQITRTSSLFKDRQQTTRFVNSLVSSELGDFIDDLTGLSNSRSLRTFGNVTETYKPTDTSTSVRVARAEMLQAFDDLISFHRDSILAIRFIDPTSNLWGQTTNVNGEVELSNQYIENYAVNRETFEQALDVSISGDVLISKVLGAGDERKLILYAPVRNILRTQVLGIVEMEVRLAPLIGEFQLSFEQSVYGANGERQVLLFDNANRLLFDSHESEELAEGEAGAATDYSGLQAYLEANPGTITDQLDGIEVISVVPTVEYAGAGFPWRIVVKDNFFASSIRSYPVALLIIVITISVCWLLLNVLERVLRTLLRPIEEARSMVLQLTGEVDGKTQTQTLNLNQPVAITSDVPLEDMVMALERTSGQISRLTERLERETRRRQRDIEIAARIGRETATLLDLNQVLDRAIELICRELNYYHAQVFLTDDVGSYAVLVRSRGEVGQQLITQGHKIAIGSQTVIGSVTGRAEPMIVNDTLSRTSGPHGYNALLPDTRAELGLPLIINNRVIGALDIQSRTPYAFNPEDLPTFQLLADQVALAVNTARLVRQTEQQLEQVQALNRLYTRQSWEEAEEHNVEQKAYRYNLMNVEPTSTPERAADDGNGGLALPISLRGEVIGMLSAAANEGQYFTEGDEVVLRAVADRVALAIENARLFQETQYTLSETQTLYQLSRYLNEATTLDDILQALVVSVVTDADGAQVWIFDQFVPTNEPEWMQVEADLAIAERDEASASLIGLRVHIPDHPFLRRLRSNQVTMINDIRTESRLDAGLQLIFRRMRARSVVMIPLNVRGEWPGLLMVEYGDPRNFDERDERIFTALVDQAGVAIDNRMLLEQAETARGRSENLYAASRIINTMQNFKDLIHAVVVTTDHLTLDFRLTLLEGDQDDNGWPTIGRIVAHSQEGVAQEINRLHPLMLPENTPLYRREPMIVHDDTPSVADVPPLTAWMRHEGYRSMAMFPLFSGNFPIALFSVMSKEIYEVTGDDEEVYRALTGQMSTQLENRRLLERTESALDEARRLYSASRAISSSQDTRAVYYTATEHLARPFLQPIKQGQTGTLVENPYSIFIAVLLAKPIPRWDAPYLECVYAWSNDILTDRIIQEGMVMDSTQFPISRVLMETTGAIYLPELTDKAHRSVVNESNYFELDSILQENPEIIDLLRRNGAASIVIAPIQSLQKWYGTIICHVQQPNAFNDRYVRFMDAITDQVALAVENRQLFIESQTEARRAQLEAQRALALAEAAQVANQIGVDFEANLNLVFSQVASAAGYNRWALYLLNERTQMLEPVISTLPGLETSTDQQYALSDANPIAAVARRKEVLLVNDPADFPGFRDSSQSYREILRTVYGKSVVAPILDSATMRVMGTLLVGRNFESDDMDSGDERLATTLATQLAVALENRRLFRQVETEQRTLQSILSTLPAGIVVLDPVSLRPFMFNEQAAAYLGEALTERREFSAANYNLYRTGTVLNYPNEELPIMVALRNDTSAFNDDVAVIFDDWQIDLLVNAAPIRDVNGVMTAIVATFSDISNLRGLENTLQENLRETVANYESQRALSESGTLEDVLDTLVLQMAMVQPTNGYVLIFDTDDSTRLSIARNLLPEEPLNDITIFDDLLSEDEVISLSHSQITRLPADQRLPLQDLGIRALITVPLRARIRNVPIGWLIVVHHELNEFGAEQERILTQLGGIASTAIDNRYLIQSTRSALQETASLYNANYSISRARDLEQLGEGLNIALAAIQPEGFSISIVQNLLKAGTVLAEGGDVDLTLIRAAFARHVIPEHGVFINDLKALTNPDEMQRDLLAAAGHDVRGLAAVRLRVKDAPSGLMMIVYSQPHRFSDTEMRFLTALSDSTSVVLDNLVLVEEIQSTLEETTILYQAGRSLPDVTAPEQIMNIVVDFLIQPHIDQVFVALLKGRDWFASGASVEVVAGWNQADNTGLQGVVFTPDQFPAWRLLGSTSLVTISDAESATQISDLERMGVLSLDARSVVVIPLRVPKRSIGAVWISSSQQHVHTDREVRIYQAFGEQASISMEAAYLLQQTERRAQQLEISAEIATRAGNILELETLLPQVVELIRGAFEFDHVQVFLMDENDEFAYVRASTGEAGKHLLSINHKLRKGSKSVIGNVTAQGRPTIALDTADANVVHMPNPYLPLTRSEMALPLMIKNRVIGALDVQSNIPNAFTDDDVRALTTLAAQISIAIENARLYAEAQTQADRMSFLFEVTTAAAAAHTLNDTLQTVAESLRESQNALAVTIYLKHEYRDLKNDPVQILEGVALVGSNQPLTELEVAPIDDPNRLISQVARRMQPFIVEDIHAHNYVPIMSQTQSVLLVPMVSGGELLGMTVLESAETYAYDFDDIQLMQALAGSISAVVQSTQLLEQLQKANSELRELDRLKSDFLANMSHELRTPLNSIIGFSRVMLKGIDGPLTEMQEQDLTTIYSSGQHLLGLINDILDQAKIAAGKMDLKYGYFDVKPVVEGVKSIGLGLIKDKPIQLFVEMAQTMPKAYGDELRTRQVLLNLVSNASKFTHQGSIAIRVYPIAQKDKTFIRVDVIDTGIGIAQKDIHLLFEAFRQVDSSLTRTAGGTGLGLPIARSLIEMQGGQMIVDSQVNVGSTFSVTIPTEPIPEPSTEENPTPEGAASGTAPSGTTSAAARPDNGATIEGEKPTTPTTKPSYDTRAIRRIDPNTKTNTRLMMQIKRQVLLIEDNPDMVDQFRRTLQRDGYEVLAASIVLEAEAMASGLRPTLIVMDVNFQRGAGWDILKRLKDRDDTFDIPIIVVTLSDDSQRAYQLGAHSFISRPFAPEDLVTVAHEAEKESHTERILIIDDNQDSIQLLTKLLDLHGNYRVFSANNGTEGIALVARRRPDLIILDLRMPDKDGFAVLDELRSNPETSSIPVLVVTGAIDLNADEQAAMANVIVLPKAGISDEEYEQFVEHVKRHLTGDEGF